MTIPAHLQQALDDARRRAAGAADDARARLRDLQSRPVPTLPTLPTLPTPTLPTLPTVTLPTGPLAEQAQTLGEARRRRQARAAVVVVVLALLGLLLRDCACAAPPPPAPSPEAVALVCPEVPECGPAPKKKPPVAKRPSVPRQAKTAPQSRDLLGVAQLRAPPWLQALRLQVTARSLALSACFNGTEKPGALRMSATATPSSGVLADPVIEPLVGGPVLTGQQRVCVTRVLTDPPYRLPTDGVTNADIGTRISLVLEF